jgi:hypothetical protein
VPYFPVRSIFHATRSRDEGKAKRRLVSTELPGSPGKALMLSRVVVALVVLMGFQVADTAAAQPSSQQGEPTFTPPSFAALHDGLDGSCKGVTLARTIALCSDADLRILVKEQQRAFDEAGSRLSSDEQKALLLDQDRWVKSYAQACGLSAEVMPSLPLAPAIRDCMWRAGLERLLYLRAFKVATAKEQPQPDSTVPLALAPPPSPAVQTRPLGFVIGGLAGIALQAQHSSSPASVTRPDAPLSSSNTSTPPVRSGYSKASALIGAEILALIVVVIGPIAVFFEVKRARARTRRTAATERHKITGQEQLRLRSTG